MIMIGIITVIMVVMIMTVIMTRQSFSTWISLFLFSSQVSIASSESVMCPSELQCSLPTSAMTEPSCSVLQLLITFFM